MQTKQLSSFLFLFLLLAEKTMGQQTKHVVFFTDKIETVFSLTQPSAFLSTRAVARRTRYGIPVDSSDLPVIPRYIDSILATGSVTLIGKLRWINAIVIQTSDAAALAKINSFPFVRNRAAIALRPAMQGRSQKNNELILPTPPSMQQRSHGLKADSLNYGNASTQIKIHKADFLHNIGARGEGMYMAFLDGGYFGYLTNSFFDSVRIQNRILATRDFVLNETSVNEDDAHGMSCFSIVAANVPGSLVGSAPMASFFLLRTEDVFTEQIIEEYNWGMGAEYADSSGVDVISSSVGYSTYDDPSFNHSYADLNGNTTVVTRYADMAAKKGILIVNSAGNEGNKSWKYIVAPSDGDSVLSVGAVNVEGTIAPFSSFGPTSHGRVKPDVVSVGQGTFLSSSSGAVASSNGTSFSAPNMAGIATCLWQLFPEVNNYKIIQKLRASSDRFAAPHEQYGYGLPDMKTATGLLLAELSTMSASINSCTAAIQWTSKDITGMQYIIERKLPGEQNYTTIQTIPAKGGSFSNQSYQYDHLIANSPAGNVLFRIIQVIDTSNNGYRGYAIDSSMVTVSGNCTTTNIVDPASFSTRIQLFPNPAERMLQLRFTEQSSARFIIILYNSLGQMFTSELYNKPVGVATRTISIGHLPKGNYVLVLHANGQRYATKEFVKQ
jgi:serine protease AprX